MKTEELDAIVRRAQPGGNVAFRVHTDDVLLPAQHARRRAAERRDKNSRSALSRKRIERAKELGSDSRMAVDELEAAIEDIRDSFGIVLHSNHSGFSVRPNVTQRELFALAAAVEAGTTYRDRMKAVNRLRKLGFRVTFTADGPKPSNLQFA